MAAVKHHGASAQSMLPNRKPQYVVSKPPIGPLNVVSPYKLCLPSLKSSYQVILDLKNISLGRRQVR